MASSQTALSRTGQVFFGSLCASTFGLGCWQTQRYFEKQELMQRRQEELSLEPRQVEHYDANVAGSNKSETRKSWQRVLIKGTYMHDKEILVGPRGPPPGVDLGGPKLANRGGGMSSGPQGYFVVTPMKMDGTDTIVLLNRGWIPRRLMDKPNSWERPQGLVHAVGVPSRVEKPRFFIPQHNYDNLAENRPMELFWMDLATMQKHIGASDPVGMLTLVQDNENKAKLPLPPPVESIGEFKVTPMIHAGYAVTWYGLAGAGVYMTRKLMTKGRG